jgi:hypothetical protein
MRRFPLVLLILAFGLSAHAAKLQKYKDWLRSPEAYFLTGSERAEWKNVRMPGVSDLSRSGTTLVRGNGRGYLRYTLIFPPQALTQFGGKAYVVDVDVDLTTGKGRLARRATGSSTR